MVTRLPITTQPRLDALSRDPVSATKSRKVSPKITASGWLHELLTNDNPQSGFDLFGLHCVADCNGVWRAAFAADKFKWNYQTHAGEVQQRCCVYLRNADGSGRRFSL